MRVEAPRVSHNRNVSESGRAFSQIANAEQPAVIVNGKFRRRVWVLSHSLPRAPACLRASACGGVLPSSVKARGVAMRPRGVRMMNCSRSRYGSISS